MECERAGPDTISIHCDPSIAPWRGKEAGECRFGWGMGNQRNGHQTDRREGEQDGQRHDTVAAR